jgi:hypothetical protein
MNLQKAMKKNIICVFMKGYRSRTCCTAKHLADLHQASIKEKQKRIEMNFAYHSDPEDPLDYFDSPSGEDLTILMVLISLKAITRKLII